MDVPTNSDERGADVTRVLIDVDVEEWIVAALRSTGADMVHVPAPLHRRGDQVLAEASRQDRVLLTHDRRYLRKRTSRYAANPSVVVLPRNGSGRLDWSLIHAIVTLGGSRRPTDWAIFAIRADGNFTFWMPDVYTKEVKPSHGRVKLDRTLEIWSDDLGY